LLGGQDITVVPHLLGFDFPVFIRILRWFRLGGKPSPNLQILPGILFRIFGATIMDFGSIHSPLQALGAFGSTFLFLQPVFMLALYLLFGLLNLHLIAPRLRGLRNTLVTQ
jgi:hypothetical protein